MRLVMGDIVTFAYDNYSSRSLPIYPKIIRVRKDLTWKDVLRENAPSPSNATPALKSMNTVVIIIIIIFIIIIILCAIFILYSPIY